MRDFSNQAEIGVDHGLNSGQSLYGVDFSADLVGLRVRGEIAANTLYRKFPVIGGHNDDTRSHAWYLNLLRTLPRFHRLQVGAEFFHIGPEYGGGYDSRRGGVVLWSGKADRVAEFPLVDDNDDGDRYPDDNVKDFFGGTAKEAGVFPGLDEDNDNIPDNDRNANGIPDYEEPFLLYDSDPQEFVYGLDMNNNGVIDARENDDKPEYPYDRDREGKHFTAAVRPLPGLELAAGYYRLVAITAGGRALSTYLRAVYKYSQPEHFTLDLNHDSKRVKDTIPDPVYVFHPGRIPEPLEPLGMPDPDPLLQQNSRVHTSFFGLRYKPISPAQPGDHGEARLQPHVRCGEHGRVGAGHKGGLHHGEQGGLPLGVEALRTPSHVQTSVAAREFGIAQETAGVGGPRRSDSAPGLRGQR